MQQSVAFDQIRFRAAKLRLTAAELARAAGVHPSAASRILNGDTRDPRTRTMQRLVEALEREEALVRRHLRELERSADGQLDVVDTIRGGTAA